MLTISNATPSTFSILRAHHNTIEYSESAISYSARFSSDSTVARSSSCSSFSCSLCANRSMTSTLLHSAHAQRARPRAPLACVLSVPRRVERLLHLDQAREGDGRLVSTLTFSRLLRVIVERSVVEEAATARQLPKFGKVEGQQRRSVRGSTLRGALRRAHRPGRLPFSSQKIRSLRYCLHPLSKVFFLFLFFLVLLLLIFFIR